MKTLIDHKLKGLMIYFFFIVNQRWKKSQSWFLTGKK